jgi:hypothetical protein
MQIASNVAQAERLETSQRALISSLMLFSIVALSRIPFVLTHYVQEDAYISARAIRNLVTHGALAFNVGDRYSPVTSLAWGYVAAVPAVLMSPEQIMLGFQLLGIASVGLAIVLLRRFLASFWSTVALALCSPALFASFLGMETGMCILYLALVAVTLLDGEKRPRMLYLLAAAGPLIRPELIAVSLLLVALTSLTVRLPARDKWIVTSAPVLGALAYVTLNLVLSNELISPSIIAKSLSYPHEHSLRAMRDRMLMVFSGQFIIPSVKQLPSWVHVAFNLAPLVLLVRRLRDRTAPVSIDEGRALVFVLFVAYGMPCLFCYGGQFAQWYMFPSAFFAVLLALWSMPASWHERARIKVVVLSGVSVIALGQLALSYSDGTQEFGYRAGVGRWLRQQAAPGATLLLEPAGYIPFYSDLKTYDDVGLVSPVVLAYIRSHGRNWWMSFVRDSWPDWIVDRHDFRVSRMTDSWYQLSEPEQRCLLARYELVRVFHYDPHDYAPNRLALRVLQMGSHGNYYVYRLRSGTQGSVALR